MHSSWTLPTICVRFWERLKHGSAEGHCNSQVDWKFLQHARAWGAKKKAWELFDLCGQKKTQSSRFAFHFVLGTWKKFTRNVASQREIFLWGVGHVSLAVPVLLHSHSFSALIHTISLHGSHFAIYYTQLYVHCCKYWFLVSRCRKILRNFAKCVLSYAKCTNLFLYKTKLITKFGCFWSEIRNEIWFISNEIQAKAKSRVISVSRSLYLYFSCSVQYRGTVVLVLLGNKKEAPLVSQAHACCPLGRESRI